MTINNTIKFMVISSLSFTGMNISVKYLVDINAFQLVFFRSASSLVFTLSFLIKSRIPILGNNRKLMVLRGLAGVASMAFFFMSIKYLPVATAVSLRYIAPIFAAIFAVLLLREQTRPIQWLFFTMSFFGVLIMKGFDEHVDTYGLILVLIAAVFSGLVYIIISKIGTGDHPVVVVNYFMIIATLVGGLLSISNWKTPEGIEWVLLLSLGVFGYFGQVYMTKAFQTAETNQVAPLKYLEVVFTLVFGLLWFDEIYTIWSILGIALIIGGLILNVLYKSKSKTNI
ncbi:DMT family transporter [Flavobacteriaceae bacterium LMO-SS05]